MVTVTYLRVLMMMSIVIRRSALLAALVVAACQPVASVASPSVAPSPEATTAGTLAFGVESYPVSAGAHPHDVAVASDGGIWYTGQQNGTLGWLDPATGAVREADLPNGAS